MTPMLQGQLVPVSLIALATAGFVGWERAQAGRALPKSRGWHARALLLNVLQVALTALGGLTWNAWFRGHALLPVRHEASPVLEAACYWFVGTFIFYWWHRLRHVEGFWQAFHQVHHSPARIELLTSFYKHPLEIVADSMLTGLLVYGLCGGSAEAGAWTSLFGATGEYFYHSNIRTPHWVGWILQRPEHHSIHHEAGAHRCNYGDITWWDRLFGTFKDTEGFATDCGFTEDREQRLAEMLLFRDVHR